ncbi:hypothetical protein ACN47E_001327 [Coniothyrium glycines]
MRAHISRFANGSRLLPPRVPICTLQRRSVTTDTRNRLSKFWAPTGGISPQDGEQDESHSLLVRGGFLRQAHSGVFHLLPLGLRVQNKLEALIDKHMQSIGASKVSMSSITTEDLWKQSGRYSANSELLRIKDRRDSGFLLSPTHEEEITMLVAGMINSYKDLPIRLYQTGRKYRDERRPRQGLLRAKEFMMKDLYTFDYSSELALQTYDSVRKAYNNLFNELNLPYIVADADSGNMGGKLSHEYHFVSPKGEDNIWSCTSCSYVANEELVEKRAPPPPESPPGELVIKAITTDHKTAINIRIPAPEGHHDASTTTADLSSLVNIHALKRALPAPLTPATGIEPATLTSLLRSTTSTLTIHDASLSPPSPSAVDLTPILPSSPCPRCPTGTLAPQKAIEVGHTFHLGTRYSEPLHALVAGPDAAHKTAVHMGCHGIGVSRILGAVAGLLADARGLNWPRAMAPFDVAVVPAPRVVGAEAEGVYDLLRGRREMRGVDGEGDVDVVLDDREKSLGWKLRDADLIGYPVLVVMGRGWTEGRRVEVQCRRLGVKREVGVDGVVEEVRGLLARL